MTINNSDTVKQAGRWLIISGTLYLLTVIVFFLIFNIEIDAEKKKTFFEAIPKELLYGTYKIGFIIRTLGVFCNVLILFCYYLICISRDKIKIQYITGIASVIAFKILIIICYTVQIIMPASTYFNTTRAERLLFYVNGSDVSYILILGYFFWAISALIIGLRLLKNKGFEFITGIVLMISSITAIVLFILLTLKSYDNYEQYINLYTMPLITGVVFIPFAVSAIASGFVYIKDSSK